MMNKIRAGLSKLAAIGAVRRRGVGALQAYGGKVEGEGHVIHNSGPKKGKKTHFVLEGNPGSKHDNDRSTAP